MPRINIYKWWDSVGERISEEWQNAICKVKQCEKHLYKIIREKDFKSGDEVRISKIAGKCGVGPRFYAAFVTQSREKGLLIVIEMEELGKALGSLPEMKESETLDQGMSRLYLSKEKMEKFYFNLFLQLFCLSEQNIAYKDLHTGNIIPHGDTIRLIDFERAVFKGTPEEARDECIKQGYARMWFICYSKLGERPDESLELLRKFPFT